MNNTIKIEVLQLAKEKPIAHNGCDGYGICKCIKEAIDEKYILKPSYADLMFDLTFEFLMENLPQDIDKSCYTDSHYYWKLCAENLPKRVAHIDYLISILNKQEK